MSMMTRTVVAGSKGYGKGAAARVIMRRSPAR